VHITRVKALEVAAYLSGKLVLYAGAWLQRIVLRYQNVVAGDGTPVHLKDAIFQDVSVVVKIVWRKGLRDLNQLGADFNGAEGADFPVHSSLDGTIARSEHESGQKENQTRGYG